MQDGIQRTVLKELAARLVMNKSELIDFLKDKTDTPYDLVEVITKSLYREGLLTYVNPIGESCVAITQKGIREVR